MHYKFKLSKDGNQFEVRTSEGIINYQDALSTLGNYEPFQVLYYEAVHSDVGGKRNKGFFGLF